MKKVISLVLVALLMAGAAYAAQPLASPGIGDILGQGDFASDPHRIFRLVRWIPQSTIATLTDATLTADTLVVWDCVSDDGVTITTTNTTNDSAVAGVAVIAILTPESGTQGNTAVQDLGKRNWGWLQTYGKADVLVQTDNVTVSADDALGTCGIRGYAGSFQPSTSESEKNGNAGFWYDAGTGGSTAEAFIICD